MKPLLRYFPVTALILCHSLAASPAADAPHRGLPRPLPGHPGNVFLAGEEIVVPLPSGTTNAWRLVDYRDNTLHTLPGGAAARPGRLPVGFYRLRPPVETHSNWISFAVIAPLVAPTPLTSPVALDVATAWFYPAEQMDAVANLCALAGVNWVRDRLNWGEMEPQRGQFRAAPTRYDLSAAAQARAGLQVLQVNHISPRWAATDTKRFPEDLRDAFNFYREMARRWRGEVRAFEPWNEADIPMFGGHTGTEMAAFQKAAYLGLKAGNAEVIVGQNVFASHNVAQLEDLRDNAVAPYFDTFNLHHYEAFNTYPKLYADFRSVSAGKPLWVTEAARPMKWSDEKSKEPSDADLREQSERLVKTFALALHEGAAELFYFLLPHYIEGQTQFGVLRPDLTPRPAFVSLAAVGRLLADAKPLGKWVTTNADLHAVWLQARPDGREADVLAAWVESGEATLELPAAATQVFDHLGAVQTNALTLPSRGMGRARLSLQSAPILAVFPSGTARQVDLVVPPVAPIREQIASKTSTVVLQAVWPEAKTMLKRSAYRIESEKPETIPVWAYNFGNEPVRGTLRPTAPDGWKITSPSDLAIPPMGREQIKFIVEASGGARHPIETVRLSGDFGPAGEAVLSLRFLPDPLRIAPDLAVAIPGANVASRWRPMISGGGPSRVASELARVIVAAEPVGDDKWIYPVFGLAPGELPPAGATGLCFSFTLLEGAGDFRVIFDERNGSGYVADFTVPPKLGEAVEQMVFFSDAVLGAGWSKPDANHRLDPGEISSIKIGGNTKGGSVKYSFGKLRWVKF